MVVVVEAFFAATSDISGAPVELVVPAPRSSTTSTSTPSALHVGDGVLSESGSIGSTFRIDEVPGSLTDDEGSLLETLSRLEDVSVAEAVVVGGVEEDEEVDWPDSPAVIDLELADMDNNCTPPPAPDTSRCVNEMQMSPT